MRIIFHECVCDRGVCESTSMNETCLDTGVFKGYTTVPCKCEGSVILQKYPLTVTKATASVQESLNTLVQRKGSER